MSRRARRNHTPAFKTAYLSAFPTIQARFARNGAGERNRTLVFSLEVSGFSQCFQEPFRHFSASWLIEIVTEFLFVGMTIAAPSSSC